MGATDDVGADPPAAEDADGPVTVWQRWYGDPLVPFHRYCDLFAFSGPPGQDGRRVEPAIHYTSGRVRGVLRRTPLFVLTAVGLSLIAAWVSPRIVGVEAYLAGTQFAGALPWVLVGVGWLIVLLWLVNAADVLPHAGLVQGVVVYLLLGGLVAAVVVTVATTALQTGDAGPTGGAPVNAVSGLGFLLMLFLGGQLVYDGMLKTEHMFSRLHEKEPAVIGPSADTPGETAAERRENAREAYRSAFLGAFEASLQSRVRPLGVVGRDTPAFRTAHVFAVLFVAPFFGVGLVQGYLTDGTLGTSVVSTAANVVAAVIPALLDVVLVIVFFQFLVLISYFNRLLADHSPDNDRGLGFTLQYRPRHPDGHAGFRDMGRFATRVNSLLIVGGLYVAYRIYVGGIPSLPAGRGAGAPELGAWAVNYLGPLAFYVLAVVVWMYFSFWQIHKAMRRGRERAIEVETVENDGELPESKLDLLQAPVWPLNVRLFASLIVGDMLPLLSLLPAIQ